MRCSDAKTFRRLARRHDVRLVDDIGERKTRLGVVERWIQCIRPQERLNAEIERAFHAYTRFCDSNGTRSSAGCSQISISPFCSAANAVDARG